MGRHEVSNCVICSAKLGNRNKYGYCKKHRLLNPIVKAQKSKANSKWWFKNNPNKSRSKLSEEEKRLRARERMRKIRKENKDLYREQSNLRDKNRKLNDQNYRIACNMRSRLSKAIVGFVKKSSAVDDLGCTIDFFRNYLESLFEPGMSWDNYGNGKDKWNIDHIKPLSTANLSDPEVQRKLSHYSNLRPMWHIDNIKKGNKHER